MAEALNYHSESVFIVKDIYEIQDIILAQSDLIPLSDYDFTKDTVTKALDKI